MVLFQVVGSACRGGRCACGADETDRFANRSTRANDVVNDDDASFQRRADDRAALTMVLDFLAVESPRNIASQAGEIHGDRGDQRDAFIGRTKEHVEFDAACFFCFQQRLRIKRSEAVKKAAGVEKTFSMPVVSIANLNDLLEFMDQDSPAAQAARPYREAVAAYRANYGA